MNYGKIYVFFKNKFIYFLFWRYVFIFVLKNIFNFILYLVYNIKSIYLKFLYINNIYMVSFLLLKVKLLLYNNFLFKFYLNFIPFFFIKILFNILYILHIDEFFRIFKGFNILNKLKYKEDPLFFRNYFLKIPLNFYNLYMNCKNNLINYNLYDNINYFINLFLIFIFQIVYKFNLYDKYSYLYNFFLKKKLI